MKSNPILENNSPQTYYRTDHGPEIFPYRLVLDREEKRWFKAALAFLEDRIRSLSNDLTASQMIQEDRATDDVQPSLPGDEKGRTQKNYARV